MECVTVAIDWFDFVRDFVTYYFCLVVKIHRILILFFKYFFFFFCICVTSGFEHFVRIISFYLSLWSDRLIEQKFLLLLHGFSHLWRKPFFAFFFFVILLFIVVDKTRTVRLCLRRVFLTSTNSVSEVLTPFLYLYEINRLRDLLAPRSMSHFVLTAEPHPELIILTRASEDSIAAFLLFTNVRSYTFPGFESFVWQSPIQAAPEKAR